MQKWTSCEIKAALSEGKQQESRVDKLQSVLTNIKSCYPSTTGQRLVASLSMLDCLVLYNPPDVSGVWISKAVVLPDGVTEPRIVEGRGYSQAESLGSLVGDLNITLILHALVDHGNPVVGESPQAGRLDRLHPEGGRVSVRHLATRADSTLPVSALSTVDGLQKTSASCGVDTRQRKAIAIALCDQVRDIAIFQWWNENEKAREVTPEVQHLFSYYRKRCNQKVQVREERLLDISPAWGPQVYLAVSFSKDGKEFSVGSGCGPGAHQAVCNAVLDLRHNEAESYWLSKPGKPIATSVPGIREQSIVWLQENIARVREVLIVPTKKAEREPFWPQRTFVRHVAKKAYAHGIDFFYSELSAKDSPLSVVKVSTSEVAPTYFC